MKEKLFERYIKRNEKYIRNTCARFVVDGCDAEDLYQETLIRIWKEFDKMYGNESCKESTLVIRKTRHVCFEVNRTRSRKLALVLFKDPIEYECIPEENSLEEQIVARDLILKTIERLDQKSMRVFMCHICPPEPLEKELDIQELVEMSAPTIMKQMRKIKKAYESLD
jgi:RNA polymerase sigma factor (sigma-70 family)